MWDLIASVPDHCLSLYFAASIGDHPADSPEGLILEVDLGYPD